MATKPGAKDWKIKEQIVEDPASGLTFQFRVMRDGEYKMVITGDLPFGNREIIFNTLGEETAAGTFTNGLCKATWIKETSPNE